MPGRSSKTNISQKRIRPKIRSYLTAMGYQFDLVRFQKGYCNGLASLAIYSQYLSSLQLAVSAEAMDDWSWFEGTLKTLSTWDENISSLSENDRTDIERIISHLEFIQHITHYTPHAQGDLHQFLEKTDGQRLKLEYSLAGLFTAQDFLKKIHVNVHDTHIETTLLQELIRYEKRIILISRGRHTLGLFKNCGKIILYNANHKSGRQVFSANNMDKLVSAIFKAYKSSEDEHVPFGFRIFTFDKGFAYPPVKKLLAEVNGPVFSPLNHADVYSALHIAARIGCAESVLYYLKKTDNVDPFSPSNRTPLYIAASRGYFDIVKLLLKHGADLNKVCDDKTPLDRAREKERQDIVRYMLRYGSNKIFKTNNKYMFFAQKPSRLHSSRQEDDELKLRI